MVKPLDPYTFGKFPAAVNLAAILSKEENTRYQKKTARLLNRYCKYFFLINHIPCPKTRIVLLRMVYLQSQIVIDKCNLPLLIKTHAQCVVTSFYRIWLKTNKSVHNKEKTCFLHLYWAKEALMEYAKTKHPEWRLQDNGELAAETLKKIL